MPMKPFAVRATVAFACLLLLGTARADKTVLLPPGEAIAGRTQAEWSVAWWQWARSFERDSSPVADRTGAMCGARQSGDVWFLAGTYGTRRTIRACKVPAGKHLFFPLINYVVYPRPGAVPPPNCMSVMGEAAVSTDDVAALILDIDDTRFHELALHRQATRQCFDLGAAAQPPQRVYPSAANGYYVMLRPLPPGRHVINFGGALPGMLQAVTYTLDVE